MEFFLLQSARLWLKEFKNKQFYLKPIGVTHIRFRRSWFDSWVGKIRWRRNRLPTSAFLGFPCGSSGKEFSCSVGDLGSIPGLGRSPGERKGYPLQYSGLENSMDSIVHGVAKSLTRLSAFHLSGGQEDCMPLIPHWLPAGSMLHSVFSF